MSYEHAISSRQLGNNEFAIQNCEMLERMICPEAQDDQAPPIKSPSLKAYVERHKSFRDSVRYNRALALSKIPNWEANKHAVKLLDEITSKTDAALNPLAKSAKAAALLFQLTELKEAMRQAEKDKAESEKEHKQAKPQAEMDRAETEKRPAQARLQAELDEVEKEILKICGELEALTKRGELSRGLALAHAVALNAKGFLLETKNDHKNARRALEAASALQPNFVEPHINLGRLYRHGQQRVADDWVVRAQGHLAQALALQPENRDANYQMGRLLGSDAMLRYADALAAFAKAAPHSQAAYFAAEIYFDSDFAEADTGKGIEQLRTSIRLSPKVDFRLGILADHCLDAAEQKRTSAITLLAQAASSVTPPRKEGSPLPADVQKLCDRASDLLEEADRAVSRMAKSGSDQLKRWAEKAGARSAEIRKGFPT